MERDQATKFIYDLLRLMVSKKASDLFITAGFPPAIKLDGKVTPVSQQPLSPVHTAELVRSVMNDRQAAEFEATKECQFAIPWRDRALPRERASSRATSAWCCGRSSSKIPTFESLGPPAVLKDVCMTRRGLVIMVATGSGKSTSLAAMVGYQRGTPTATSSRSRTRSSTSTRTATASSRSARSGSTPNRGERPQEHGRRPTSS